MKKLIAFDLDDTLAVTKSPISDEMAEVLVKLSNHFQICIISGGKLEQFNNQVMDRLIIDEAGLKKFHLMPTCGTRYYKYEDDWKEIYAENLSGSQKKLIIDSLREGAVELGYWLDKPYGEIIEDRGSQITFSALGQEAPAEEKYKWDPDGKKRMEIISLIGDKLQNLEARVGGSTSIDVTLPGIDKAYGMKKLMEQLNIAKEDILFFGDKLQPGGNDYPVKMMGIDSLEVNNWQDTVLALTSILHVL